MRTKILNFLRVHPITLNLFWKLLRVLLGIVSFFVPVRPKTMLITSFAGRKYDDSPKALYEEILKHSEFDDWNIIWAFIEPNNFEIPRGRKIKIDTWAFFMALLYSKVWISNSGMDRNIGINRKATIKVETWHGTPIKKIGIDQNSNILGNYEPSKKIDKTTIRCAQSEYDRDIFARVFNADKSCFIMCGLPRNDELLKYKKDDIEKIRWKLRIPEGKKVLLYMPTYREYLVNEKRETFLTPPINLEKWENELGAEYVLLVRLHYAVSVALNVKENNFVIDVSNYPSINDLYIASDILISDYSSAFFDYSITNKCMLHFTYDFEEYQEKRGVYFDIREYLSGASNENGIINILRILNYQEEIRKTISFRNKYVNFYGDASRQIVNSIVTQCNYGRR